MRNDGLAILVVAAMIAGSFYGWHGLWVAPTIVVVCCAVVIGWQAILFLLMDPAVRNRRMRILEADYGREAGWYVEIDGRRVAILKLPMPADMFWVSYYIEPLTEDVAERQRILSDCEWWHQQLTFRNREFDEIAPFAFAGECLSEPRRVVMRGLYLLVDDPNAWDRLMLCVRRTMRQR